jgi:hypothetical protein
MPLQGTFDVLDFTEVLQLLASQRLTGRLHVRSRSFGANLFLEEGLLVGADQSEHQPAATTGDVRGRIEEICFEMLDAERGSFEFQPGKPSTLPVVERHRPEAVLEQARKRLEEWHELQEVIPSLELQPRLVLDLAANEVTLDRERWRMLTAIDGRRNLRAIGRLLNLSDFDVCRVVRRLIEDNIVALDGMAALPASTRDAMPVVPTPDASGREGVRAEPRSTAGADAPTGRLDLPTLASLPSPGPLVVTGVAVPPGTPARPARPAREVPAESEDRKAGVAVELADGRGVLGPDAAEDATGDDAERNDAERDERTGDDAERNDAERDERTGSESSVGEDRDGEDGPDDNGPTRRGRGVIRIRSRSRRPQPDTA